MNQESGTTAAANPVSSAELELMNAWWHAANYLSVGQIYLLDNPLLEHPLERAHIKPRLLGHWGTTPGLNFIYVHLNRVIKARDLDMIYICGPGHGGPGMVANTWLEGTYSEIYPNIPQDKEGMRRLFRQFSFPGGIPSHAAPETPGSIHEGGELGYSLSHAYGAALDNPELIVACVVGDGEAETGPLATSWNSNKFFNPATAGAVLPILHLNGYKIANPTILARIPRDALEKLFLGYGYKPHFVEGDDPSKMHQLMAATLDRVLDEIAAIQTAARNGKLVPCPQWPMIILRSPKGWTGPKYVDGLKIEGTWRSHQVPFGDMERPEHVKLLEEWMRSYRPQELFDGDGRLRPEIAALAPQGDRRMSANPHANGGLLRRDLVMPNFADYAVEGDTSGSRRCRGDAGHGRVPARRDETEPGLPAFWPGRDCLEPPLSGFRSDRPRVDGGDLTRRRRSPSFARRPRHGDPQRAYLRGVARRLSADRAARLVQLLRSFHPHRRFDVQPARQMAESSRKIPWRRPISSLNYLLTSHVWRQDHNGFSHQDPGFIDYVTNKKADIIRVYLPPDANTLLWVTDHCLRSWDRINVIVAGKQPAPQWLDMDVGDQALRCRDRHLGMGEQRPRQRARRGDGVRRRRPDPGDVGGGRSSASPRPRSQDPRRQCRRSDDPAAARGASARHHRP